jgi:hypothetical protein
MSPALRAILSTPHSLVSDGRFALGTYKAPFERVNPLDARLGALWPWPRRLKNWRLKEWEHFALVNDQYYLSVALFNSKILGLAQVCVYSRKDGAIHFYERKTPPWKISLTNNQVEDQPAYNENCVWQDGRLCLLPPVTFSFDRRNHRKPWVIRDRDGMVELTFEPEVVRTVDINALLLRSRYRAPFGAFSGRLRTGDGDEIEVDDYFGMCEDFYLRS